MDDPLVNGWRLSLTADRCSPGTIETYMWGVRSFAQFFERPLTEATRADIRAWLSKMQQTRSVNTVRAYLKAVNLFFRWAVDEGDIVTNPAAGIDVPSYIPDIPILSDDEVRAMLSVATGTTWRDRRDRAIIHVLLDTGMRLSELTLMREDDVDLNGGIIVIQGKGARRQGKRIRAVAIGSRCALALSRWMRARQTVAFGKPEVWIGNPGQPYTQRGIYSMIRRRGEEAGIKNLHPHRLRHTWADRFRLAGGSEGDLMVLGGWESRTMLDRYGKTGASRRAIEAAKKLSLADRI